MKSNLPYNVMRHKNWDAAPRMPQAVAAAFTGFSTFGAAAAAGSAFAYGAVYVAAYVGITAITSWAISALSPKPDFSSFGSQGTLVNSRDATASSDFVYGEVRKGGTVAFYESTGAENKYLHQVIVLAGHEIEEIGDIYINDEVVSWNASTGLVSGDWGDKIRIRKHLGDQTTADADLVGETSVGSSFVGNGIAYLYVRYEYDRDVFANGLPLVTAKTKGKKVYDPRSSATVYSNNAALCMRDFIVSEYGLNDSAIDDVSFSVAANESDENVSLSGGGTEKRYTINGIVKASSPIGDVLGKMSTACAGTLFWGSGYWKLKVGAYSSPVKTLTLDDLRGPIALQTRTSMRDNFNGVSGTFNNADEDFITMDYPPIKSSVFEVEDGGDELLLDLPLPFTTSAPMAQRLAKLTLYRGREQMNISADFGLEAFDVEVGDIIAFDNERYGFDGKEFEVVGWRFASNQEAGDLRVSLTLQETSAAAFDWNAEEAAIISNNTTLPVYTAGMTVLGLSVSEGGLTQSDGTRISTAIVDWSDVTNAYLERYEVQWKPTADTSYSSTFTSQSDIELSPIVDGVEYTFRVRAVSANGYRGPFASVAFTGGGDVTAPSLPTAITAVGGFEYITIRWTRPSNADFSYVEVYENTSNTTSGATKVGDSAGNEFVRTNLSISQTKYYFLKSVDYSGNKSAFTSGVSGTSTFVDDASFADGIYSLFTDQGLYAIRDVTSLPASGSIVGEKIFNRTDGKLYQWTGSAWVLVVADVEDGSITGVKIDANAITAPKILAGTITGNKIVANTITGGLLATSGIITNSAQINNLVVESAKIKNLAVERIKIGDNAVSEVNTASIGKYYTAGQFQPNTEIVSLPSPTLNNITTECYFSFVFDAITNPAPHYGYLPSNGWMEVRLQIQANFSSTFPASFVNIGPVFSSQVTNPNAYMVNKPLLTGSVFVTPTTTHASTAFRVRISTAVYNSSGVLQGTTGRVDGVMFTRMLAK